MNSSLQQVLLNLVLLVAFPRIAVRRKNYIDDYIFGKMEQAKVPYAGLSSDTEYLRRVRCFRHQLLVAPS